MSHPGSWWRMVLAGWLLAGFAPTGQATSFTDDFAPDKWQLDSASFNPGAFIFTGASNTEMLRLTSSLTPGFSDTLVALKAPYATAWGVLSFTWTLTANGNVSEPLGYFNVGSEAHELGLGSGSLAGIEMPMNTPIYFELLGDLTPGKSPAKLEVTGWEISVVPEPGTAVLSLLGLALLGYSRFWRMRKGDGLPPAK